MLRKVACVSSLSVKWGKFHSSLLLVAPVGSQFKRQSASWLQKAEKRDAWANMPQGTKDVTWAA